MSSIYMARHEACCEELKARIIQCARLEPVEAGRWQKQASAPAEPAEPWWSGEDETPKSQPIG